MQNELKQRYIYAVTRHLPVKMQGDVAKELDSLLTEMIEERFSGTMHTEEDVKGILAELGPPEELALKYRGDRRTALISGAYYLMYVHVLRIVLPIVAAAMVGLGLLGLVQGAPAAPEFSIFLLGIDFGAGSFVRIITDTAGALVHAFAIVTVIFAVMDYRKSDLRDGADIVSSLPTIPAEAAKVSKGESAFGIIISIAMVVVFLVNPHVFGAHVDGVWIPVFDIEAMRGLWLPIILFAIFGIGMEIAAIVEGWYTMRLAVITLISNIIVAICAISIFSGNIINPEFISFAESTFTFDGAVWLADGLSHANWVVLAIILIVAAAETISAFVKALMARR